MATEKILTGIAGEYFVAGELSRRGIVAGLTLRNTAHVDIFATSNDGFHSASIQVKTRRNDKGDGWLLGSKLLETKKEWGTIFYVFVTLPAQMEDRNIEYYIIPKNLLNKEVEKDFQKWRRGGERRKSEARVFRLGKLPQFAKYKDYWDIIFG